MPKDQQAQQDTNKLIWETVQRHTAGDSVARIPRGPQQLAEIERRLSAAAADFAALGAAITPTAAQLCLGLDHDTYNRWAQGKAIQKDERGINQTIALDKSSLDEDEKQYIVDRSELIKNALQQAETVAVMQAQHKDNRENGGALFVLQNVYGYGQQQGRDQVTFSLEDLLQAAAAVRERRDKDKT